VLIIYDIDMPIKEARFAVKYHFLKYKNLEDHRYVDVYLSVFVCSCVVCRVIGLLMAKGYMELEETLMHWKQKTHLMRILEVIFFVSFFSFYFLF
jgi:hypothetical protein